MQCVISGGRTTLPGMTGTSIQTSPLATPDAYLFSEFALILSLIFPLLGRNCTSMRRSFAAAPWSGSDYRTAGPAIFRQLDCLELKAPLSWWLPMYGDLSGPEVDSCGSRAGSARYCSPSDRHLQTDRVKICNPAFLLSIERTDFLRLVNSAYRTSRLWGRSSMSQMCDTSSIPSDGLFDYFPVLPASHDRNGPGCESMTRR